MRFPAVQDTPRAAPSSPEWRCRRSAQAVHGSVPGCPGLPAPFLLYAVAIRLDYQWQRLRSALPLACWVLPYKGFNYATTS